MLTLTPTIYIDQFGRVGCTDPGQLSDELLLTVAQLRGLPLPRDLTAEITDRGLRPELARLFEAERLAPNH